ncbi:probable DELTA-alicitoxin-Pse2b at C-terminar half [Coccomyxa sp. Obi]|nr:probable DELTA-alicitoxin-Pse2b at C-terminar half [Coccomyxa sp. Obi]
MRERQAILAVLACIIYSYILTPATGTFDIIANDVNRVVDALLHKSQPATTAPPVPTGPLEIFSAGFAGDNNTVISSSPVLLSAIVLKAGAPALTNTSLQQDYVPYIVILSGNVIFRANGTVIGNASYTGDPESMLLLPAYSVVFDTSLLAPGTYSISATYEGPDYPPTTYPASIPLTIVPPISKSLSLSLFDNTGTKLQPGTYPVTPTDIIYAVLQLDDDSTEAVSEGSMTLSLTSANDSSFKAHYFADLASTLEAMPIVDVEEGLAGSFFTISDFPLGLISISGQYIGTGAIASTPVLTSAVKLAVTSPSPTALSLEAGSVLQAGQPVLPTQISFVLGRAYYLKLVNVFDNLPVGKALFNTDVAACLVTLPANRANGYVKFLKTSNEFYDFVSTQTSISASAPTVKVTAEASYGRLQTSRNDRTSYTSLTYTSNNDYSLDLDCISAGSGSNYFSKDFLTNLDNLPLDITDPAVGSSWNAYEIFFQKFGSHYVYSLTTGGLINAWATSESSKSYSQSDFAAKACATAEGPDPLVNKSISGCAGVTATSRSASSSFEMNTQVYVRGGSPATQAALVSSKGAFTDALIDQFFAEAKTSDAPIDYQWAPIHELIQQSFQTDDARYNKGRNLQAYYEGYIASGCTKDEKNGIVLRRFSKVDGGTLKTYQCERACQGCRSNDDCHSHNGYPFACYCEGRSCVVANGDYSTIKESPNNSPYEDPENASCQYKPFNCKCDRGDTECSRQGKDYIRVGPFYPAQ